MSLGLEVNKLSVVASELSVQVVYSGSDPQASSLMPAKAEILGITGYGLTDSQTG